MTNETFASRLERFRLRRAGPIRLSCYGLSVGLLLAVWQVVGNDFGILFVPFTKTMRTLVALVADGTIPAALVVSGKIYLLTLLIDIVVGISLGLCLARIRWFGGAFEPYVYLLYTTPTVALVPMVFSVFGFSTGPQILVAVVISVFPIVFGVMEGTLSIPSQFLDVADNFGSSESQLWRDVIVPYVTPFIMTGVRQTIALALVGTLVAEFFLDTVGIVGLLAEGATEMNPAQVLAVTLVVSLFAIVLVGVGELIERYLVRWRYETVG